MGSKCLVICDPEEGYACALASYFLKRKELAFQVYTYRSLQKVQEMPEEIDYLFLSADYDVEERNCLKAGKKFILTVTGQEPMAADEQPVCKYQSGDAVFAELIHCLSSDSVLPNLFLGTARKDEGKLIGVYSPVHRVGKTRYAIEAGRRLAVKSEVLYVNMEIYGGKGGNFAENPSYTLADILYYVRQESKNLSFVLSTMTERVNGLDYISPMPVSEDIKAVSPGEWVNFIRQIMENSIYEAVILDIDEGIQGVYDILRLCTEIHMPVENSEISGAKVRQFEEELQLLGYEDVLQKLIRKEQKG